MEMFHVTPKEYIEEIKECGFLNAPVYLSPYRETATTYGDSWNEDYVIISINVDESLFNADMEFCKGGNSNLITESLENGSVYLKEDLNISEANLEYVDVE